MNGATPTHPLLLLDVEMSAVERLEDNYMSEGRGWFLSTIDITVLIDINSLTVIFAFFFLKRHQSCRLTVLQYLHV